MAEILRINIRLNLQNPLHRAAWEILRKVPEGQRTQAVCLAILEKNMLELLRKILREELEKFQFVQPENKQEVMDEEDAVLDFLFSLQEGADP